MLDADGTFVQYTVFQKMFRRISWLNFGVVNIVQVTGNRALTYKRSDSKLEQL